MSNPAVTKRNDLLALKTNVKGAIGPSLLPVFNQYGLKSAPITAALISDLGTSSTTRDGSTGVITGNARSATPITCTCTEDLSRQIIREDEIPQYGGQAQYDAALAFAGNLEVQLKQEAKVKAALMAGSPTDATSNTLRAVQAKVQALSSYGRVILAGSATAFNVLRFDSEFAKRMINTGVAPSGTDPRSITSAQIAAVVGASEVREATGPFGAVWPYNEIIVFVEADPSIDPRSIPQVGRLVTYAWNEEGGAQTLTVEQKYDTATNSEVYDFIGWSVAKLFNADLCAYMKIAAATTTTTTTTAG